MRAGGLDQNNQLFKFWVDINKGEFGQKPKSTVFRKCILPFIKSLSAHIGRLGDTSLGFAFCPDLIEGFIGTKKGLVLIFKNYRGF